MTQISKAEFNAICEGISGDSEKIVEHNPIGTREETLLWMLLSVLNSYLSLDDADAPCFTGRPDANTFRLAIDYVLQNRRVNDFDHGPLIEKMLEQ